MISAASDPALAKRLILDELFDLSLYTALREVARGGLRDVLDQLIPVETRHVGFWQEFFDLRIPTLDLRRRLKLRLLVGAARLGGAPVIHLILEAIEVYGVRKYLAVWKQYGGGPLAEAVRGIQNLTIIAATVGITYLIGTITKAVWGITV